MSKKTHSQGFTLVELLVTIAIVATLTVLGLPAMRGSFERNAVSGHVNTFIGSLRYARAEAVKRGVTVKMCRSVGAETAANPACAAGSGNASPGWSTGWIIFLDRNNDNDVDANDVVLRIQESMSSSGGIEAGVADLIFLFRPTGMLATTGAGQFTFKSKSSDAAQSRRVCVSMQGRARISASATVACTNADV